MKFNHSSKKKKYFQSSCFEFCQLGCCVHWLSGVHTSATSRIFLTCWRIKRGSRSPHGHSLGERKRKQVRGSGAAYGPNWGPEGCCLRVSFAVVAAAHFKITQGSPLFSLYSVVRIEIMFLRTLSASSVREQWFLVQSEELTFGQLPSMHPPPSARSTTSAWTWLGGDCLGVCRGGRVDLKSEGGLRPKARVIIFLARRSCHNLRIAKFDCLCFWP